MNSVRTLASRDLTALLGLVLGVLMLSPIAALAARTDVVVIVNGDHLTGEVKSLDRGRLRFKTDNAGDVYIEWDKIRFLDAVRQFDIETSSGRHIVGSLLGRSDEKLHVLSAQDSTTLGFDSIVRITPLNNTLWGKMDGSLDIGSNFALANHLAQFNIAGTARYRERHYALGTELNSSVTHQDELPDARRGTFGLSYTRFFENRWQTEAGARLERNDQLGLDLRAGAAAGFARYLMQTNFTLLDVGLGLSANQEQRADGTKANNLEAVVSSSYSTFIYDSPKVNVDAYARLYPSLSDWGRLRFEGSAVVKREVVKDLYLGINGVESYDSKPAEGSTHNDWNAYLSIGWTF